MIIDSSDDLTNDICSISKKNLSNLIDQRNVIKLYCCKQCFYYPDFKESFFINNKNFYSYNRCPYCFSKIDFKLNYSKKA